MIRVAGVVKLIATFRIETSLMRTSCCYVKYCYSNIFSTLTPALTASWEKCKQHFCYCTDETHLRQVSEEQPRKAEHTEVNEQRCNGLS